MDTFFESVLRNSGLDLQLSSNLTLIDLLLVTNFQPPSHSLAIDYLTSLFSNTSFFLSSNLSDCSPFSIILTADWTLCFFLSSYFLVSSSDSQLSQSREFLNSTLGAQPISTIELPSQPNFSYVLLSICRSLLSQSLDIPSLVMNYNFESCKASMRSDLIIYIYSKTELMPEIITRRLAEARGLLRNAANSDLVESKEGFSFRAEKKPLCELFVCATEGSAVDSLEYTQSLETARNDSSFRLSNTITRRFPRISISSLALNETPLKDPKLSYGEYIECMESQRGSSCRHSPHKESQNTPITSPRQASFSIQQVKKAMLQPNGGENESPEEKGEWKKARGEMRRKFIGFGECEGSKGDEGKTIFEETKRSCQCQSCDIF
jgi:hypothetical protein